MQNIYCLPEVDCFCEKCAIQRDKIFEYINKKNFVTLATLGPEGTTSGEAAKYFKEYVEGKNKLAIITINLYDSFEIGLSELNKKSVDFILLPNAYGKITNFYWDSNIELVMSFINKTPKYGIAIVNKDGLLDREVLTISTCKAVEHLIPELWDTIEFKNKKYEIIEESSTKKSLILLEQGKVDLALTNDTSLVGSEAYFISKTKFTEVLWSIFMLRTA